MELALKRTGPLRMAIVVWALVLSLLAATMSPVSANTTTTRNIILGAVALTVGLILYNNYEHKVQYANSVVGYTRDGGIVYGDGRIVYPNGPTIYASNDGRQICTFNGYGVPCRNTAVTAYFPRGYRPSCWPPGHCKQYWKKHHENDDEGDHD